MAQKEGWLYCITTEVYKENNIYKCGYTAKNGFEDEVAKSLCQRYGTAFPNPMIMFLKKVSQPKKAEGKLLEKLLPYREEGKEIITADFEQIIKPNLDIVCSNFDPTAPYRIPDDVFDKLMNRLNKKIPKLMTIIEQSNTRQDFYSLVNEYTTTEKRLSATNQNVLYGMQNAVMLMPPIITNSLASLTPQQKQMLKSFQQQKRSYVNDSITRNNWDRSDENLQKFLKEFLDRF